MRDKMTHALSQWAQCCGAEISIAVVGGMWKATILKELRDLGTLRFSELRQRLHHAPSPRALTKQLRELEADGLVLRQVYPQVPPRVEYSLTDLGRSASDLVDELTRWGSRYAGVQQELVSPRT